MIHFLANQHDVFTKYYDSGLNYNENCVKIRLYVFLSRSDATYLDRRPVTKEIEENS